MCLAYSRPIGNDFRGPLVLLSLLTASHKSLCYMGRILLFQFRPRLDIWTSDIHIFSRYESIDFHLRCKIIQRIWPVRTQADCINSASFSPLDSFRSVHQWPIPPTRSLHLSKPFADCGGRRNNCCAEMRLIISGGAENSMATAPYQHCVCRKSMSLIINKKGTEIPGVLSVE